MYYNPAAWLKHTWFLMMVMVVPEGTELLLQLNEGDVFRPMAKPSQGWAGVIGQRS